MWQDTGCKYSPYICDLEVKWTDLTSKRSIKLYKCYTCSLWCVTHFSMSIEKGYEGLWSKTGFVQHLNNCGGMTNQLKDSSTRDGNLWSLWCSGAVLLPFREAFLMLKSGLLQCNPISSCLAYDRHGGHVISFLFAAAFCIFNDSYSPLSPFFCEWTHTPQFFPDFWLILPHFSHLPPAAHSFLSAVPQPPLAALAKGMADADPHRPFFFPTTELLCHLLFLTPADCSCMAGKPCTLLVLCKTSCTVKFLPLELYPPKCLQFPPTQHYVCRFEKQILSIIQVINETNEQCQTRPDSHGTQNQGAQFIPLFWQQIACNYWALFSISWILSSDHVSLSHLQKALPEAYKIKIYGIYCFSLSMLRITSSNDEIRCFDTVCSLQSYEFSFQYLWIMAWLIFPVSFQELK